MVLAPVEFLHHLAMVGNQFAEKNLGCSYDIARRNQISFLAMTACLNHDLRVPQNPL